MDPSSFAVFFIICGRFPLSFSIFAFQGHVHEESLDTREAFWDMRCITRLGVASHGDLLGQPQRKLLATSMCSRLPR